ncbi:phosphoribosyltransferase [Rhizobium leguminosarum]|uniref:phosphoribosyltransferase n=1 Tax=Rhizobium leguminosarum TaxID=384 RepID=UPI0021BBFECB|nr:phosphoribosyltransferase [Rhizobium leguminosarum]
MKVQWQVRCARERLRCNPATPLGGTQSLKIVADTLRASYLVDLVERHAPAQKSQTARQQGIALDHGNQLSTIRLRRDPLKPGQLGGRYKASPLKPGKTVLVVDDILTEGFSLEAARAFVKATGADVIWRPG